MARVRSKRSGLSGTALKWVAAGSMLADHVGAVLVREENLLFWCRLIGRLAMPLFVFLLVEGFCHTRDVRRYGGRLLLFALASEIPFDLAFHGRLLEWSGQNVFFTLFLGLCMLALIQKYQGRTGAQAAIVLFFGLLAMATRCDYDVYGIIMILLCYRMKCGGSRLLCVYGLFCGLLSLSFFGSGALAAVLIGFYNGRRGALKGGLGFSLFYPLHLLALHLLYCLPPA